MQKTACEFPEWINEFVVDDEAFARAYDAVPDNRRALLKTNIARLFEWYGPSRRISGREAVAWRGGFDSVQFSAPADYAVVVFDANLASPARLLASVVPPLACGVENVLAVRLGGDEWPEPLLTGLELAGQELVTDMSLVRVKGMLEEMDASGATGVVLGLELGQGLFRSLRFPTRNIDFICLKCDREAVLWIDTDEPFDLDGLAFAHPDLSFAVHGAEIALPPEGFRCEGNDFQDFLDSIREVAYAPASRVDEALDRARLVLGPGQEGCWVWPQLRPESFQFQSTAWTIGA
jgi:hypothetical protein